jgi:indolepyruvate ferredoxin oxidoreductase beta subunit
VNITSILLAGVGGQGIILASKILSKCAFTAGFMVKESQLHGMAQRGGSVISHVRFGEEVYSPLIPEGKADFMVALEELEGLRYTYFLKSSAQVILNSNRVPPSIIIPENSRYPENIKEKLEYHGFQVDAIKAPAIAKELGNLKVENIILLGALSRYLPFTMEPWQKTIEESVPAKTIEINMKAFSTGREIKSAWDIVQKQIKADRKDVLAIAG